MSERNLAAKILKLIGGERNVSQLTHCSTRLRFVLKDETKANLQTLDTLEGVLKAQNKGGQLQVVVGDKVESVYEKIQELTNWNDLDDVEKSRKKFSINQIFETIASIFTPLLPALVGCGMVKCISTIITAMKWVDPKSGFIAIFDMIGDSIFYFLPFFLAVSAARKFKTNEYLALGLAATLLHPVILDAAKEIAKTGVTSIDFLGLPILLVKYSSSVIPIILTVWLLSHVYKIVDRVIPAFLRVILTPMVVLLIMVPIELIVIAPFGSYVGTWLTQGINALFATLGVAAGALLGFFKPILVMFGMHYSIMPMQIQQIAEVGYTVLLPSALGANLAQAGAAFAVFFLTKNKAMKSAAGSSAITAAFGVTEPAIYGVNLKYKTPFFAGCAAAGITGGFYSFVHAKGTAIALPGLLSLSSYQADKYIYIIIGCVMAIVLGFLFTFLVGIKEADQSNVEKTEPNSTSNPRNQELSIMSPLAGDIKNLSEVNDKTFSQELMGKGIAILPKIGKVYAPFDGTVDAMFKTKHAIGLKSDSGVEVLIHIGLDTVNLDGKYFTTHVKQSQKVKQGDLLIEFDIEAIKGEEYDIITPIIVTNSDFYLSVLPTAKSLIKEKQELLKIVIDQ